MTGKSLQVKHFYKASPEKVFTAWADPEIVKKWFAPSENMSVPLAEVDFKVGGTYRIGMFMPKGHMDAPADMTVYVGGEYLEIVQNKKIVLTWRWENWPSEQKSTKITLDFVAKDGGTELVLSHEELSDDESVKSHTHGWMGCLKQLEKVV